MRAKDTVMTLEEYNQFTLDWYREQGIIKLHCKADCLDNEFKATLEHQAELTWQRISEEIKKVEQDAQYARDGNRIYGDKQAGFEDCRKKILALLK